MTKRGNGWADMEYRNRHNRVPVAPPVTKWQQLLSAIHMREEDAFMAARKPTSLAAAILRQGLQENGMYRTHYVPERVLQAFGWLPEVEARVAGEWSQGRPRKQKVRRMPDMPLLEKGNL